MPTILVENYYFQVERHKPLSTELKNNFTLVWLSYGVIGPGGFDNHQCPKRTKQAKFDYTSNLAVLGSPRRDEDPFSWAIVTGLPRLDHGLTCVYTCVILINFLYFKKKKKFSTLGGIVFSDFQTEDSRKDQLHLNM